MGTIMPRAKRKIQYAITIDGHSLIWHLHRDQQGSVEDGWRGVAIHVKAAEGVHRELFLEYLAVIPQKSLYMKTLPAQPAIRPSKVEANIRQAMADGWDPDSRGKPYVYEVEDSPA
jgi:hypothetical protein